MLLSLLPLQSPPPRAAAPVETLADSFDKHVRPFLHQHCVRCHNPDKLKSGVRVDHLDARLEDQHLRLWESIGKQIAHKVMPPEDEPQPTGVERDLAAAWIQQGLEIARSRPTPKNGGARRLTVSQYRATLKELLLIDDDFTDLLPPDAVSRDGFSNNQETLQFSPLLLEAYYEVADAALRQSIVHPSEKPVIQNFRLELGTAINSEPCPDPLILGADSLLLNNEDFAVRQLTPVKPFPFEPFFMRTKFRFIEGYQGNDTVRGWREYDSIYHAVFACMRGSRGYPKGRAYDTVPQGLLLRPAIPSAELFGVDSTYGPKANFKISLRELPDHGRFRVTVTAAKYDDGLLLDPSDLAAPIPGAPSIACLNPESSQTVAIPQAGVYRIEAHAASQDNIVPSPDPSRLADGLIASWPLDETPTPSNPNAGDISSPEPHPLAGRLTGEARFAKSPFNHALTLSGRDDAMIVPSQEALAIADGDFTVAAWIHPRELRQGGILGRGKYNWSHGWYLDMPDNRGALRLETAGPNNQSNGAIATQPGALTAKKWQHIAAVIRRGSGGAQLYVNGYAVARGTIQSASLDNPKAGLRLGGVEDAPSFPGELDEVRLYRRALGESEIQALLTPGREFIPPPPKEEPKELELALGDRHFSGKLTQPAFLALRLPPGPLAVRAKYAGAKKLDRIVFQFLPENHELTHRFHTFEKRSPHLGVHLGLRRDCGSTLAPVGEPRPVPDLLPSRFVFEGAIRNFPSPDVEPDNVNYLAGVREIGVRAEYTDGRDMPRLLVSAVEFEGPFHESWPPPSHRNIFIDSNHPDDAPAYAREIIRDFASRAFRRPVAPEEESALLRVFHDSSQTSASFHEAIRDVLQVVLTSPQFLFLTETSSTPEPEPLEDYELASKLSYFLWNGPPDPALLQLAAKGALRKHLDAQLDRMIDHPRFAYFINEFASQWLALDKFHVLEPDRARFPKLTRDARAHLRQEPIQFLRRLFQKNLPASHLIASDFIVANEAVAAYYDLAAQTESGFQFIPIIHRRPELGGILTQPAILAGLSDGRESNPIKRGAWLARRIVAEPPDDPPPNVPALPEDNRNRPLRERLEQHRNQPGCAQCHLKIDPWGIPLEEFDAGGRLKREPVDASSTLPDKTPVSGVRDLKRYLAEDRIDQVAFSFLKHLAIYATGRSLSYYEIEFLKKNAHSLKPNNYRMSDMIRFVVHSPLFLEK